MPRTAAKAGGLIVAAVVALAAVAGMGIAMAADPARSQPVRCDLADPAQASAARVAGYGGDQLQNAAVIMDTASALGLDSRAQLLGVMAAMGESGLRVLSYGDYETNGVLNPDGTPTTSIGLFQQQDWWGSIEQRLDPAQSATLFFDRLQRVEGWPSLPPTQAIHEVQVNSDADHYERWQSAAEEVTAALRVPCPASDGP